MSYDKLLIWQYRTKPKAVATAQLFANEFKRSWDGLASLPLTLSIDQAKGCNLDLVGKHVGQSRVLSAYAPRDLFAFSNAAGGGFAISGYSGARFYRKGDPLRQSVRLDDEEYRFLIRCRIAKNNMTGTVGNMTQMLRFIFGASAAAYDQYDMSVSVIVPADNIDTFKLHAIKNLDILPRPAGVGIKFLMALPKTAFCFAGQDGAGFNNGTLARFL